jgi:hypothetical protein
VAGAQLTVRANIEPSIQRNGREVDSMGLPIRSDAESMNLNVADEFMLKEYESIASAHFDSQSGLRQQFRFYLLIVAVPLTILGLAFKDRAASELVHLSMSDLPPLLSGVFLGIGFLGIFLLLSMIHTALDATLYARTVNGVRAYFVDRSGAIDIDLGKYLKMPTNQNRPAYFHIRAFFWQVILIAILNSTYVSVFTFRAWGTSCRTIALSGLIVLFQLAMFAWFCWKRQTQEISGASK